MPSRQRIYQIRQNSLGLCEICPSEALPGKRRCQFHEDQARTNRRNWYRRKVGIPLDDPISPAGRSLPPLTEEQVAQLGTMPDRVLAELWDCSVNRVFTQRDQRSIAPHRKWA